VMGETVKKALEKWAMTTQTFLQRF
jgi:hypothetical protein